MSMQQSKVHDRHCDNAPTASGTASTIGPINSAATEPSCCLLQPLIQLYISCQTRAGHLDEFFGHENQACPPALCDGGKLCLGTKSDLLTCFEEISDVRSGAPTTTSIVLDGAANVQMLKPATCKNFREYAQQIFIPYMSTRLQSSSRLDLVWDIYTADSLKANKRAKCGKEVCRCVVAEAAIPRNWQNFLRVDTNKTQLFKFLSEAVLQWFNLKDKQLVITDGE